MEETAVRVVFSLLSLGGLTVGILVIIMKLNAIQRDVDELRSNWKRHPEGPNPHQPRSHE